MIPRVSGNLARMAVLVSILAGCSVRAPIVETEAVEQETILDRSAEGQIAGMEMPRVGQRLPRLSSRHLLVEIS